MASAIPFFLQQLEEELPKVLFGAIAYSFLLASKTDPQ